MSNEATNFVRDVLDKKGLTQAQRNMLANFASRANKDLGYKFWLSMEKLMENSGLSKSAARKARSALVEKGYITRTEERRGWTKMISVYILTCYVNHLTPGVNKNKPKNNVHHLSTINPQEELGKGVVSEPLYAGKGVVREPLKGVVREPHKEKSERKRRERKSITPISPKGDIGSKFWVFWEAMPKNGYQDITKAQRIWKEGNLEVIGDHIIEKLMVNIQYNCRWNEPQYIPSPQQFLKQKRYDKEIPGLPQAFIGGVSSDIAPKSALSVNERQVLNEFASFATSRHSLPSQLSRQIDEIINKFDKIPSTESQHVLAMIKRSGFANPVLSQMGL